MDTGGSFINAPGAIDTYAYGINDSGQIVGDFVDALGSHGFVDTGGSFTTVDVPGFCCTSAQGINDNGQIVGWVGYPASPEMAFVATPGAIPEPPSLLTLATCLAALSGTALQKRRNDLERDVCRSSLRLLSVVTQHGGFRIIEPENDVSIKNCAIAGAEHVFQRNHMCETL